MSLNRSEKLWQRQGDAIKKEAEKAGSRVLTEETVPLEQAGTKKSILKSAWTASAGGKMQTDAFQIFAFDAGGLKHFCFQPYSGVAVLPGEHHAFLSAGVPRPLNFSKGMLGKKWQPADDPSVQAYLAETGLAQASRKLVWEWKIGTSKIVLPWVAQLAPLGAQGSHLAMYAGRYGGLTKYVVGIQKFLGLANAAAKGSVPGAPEDFIHPTQYGELIYSILSPQPAGD
jgi:hypothetical protein